ncbi:unnamed protein product [Closterium sp. Naga37s-1]|nr:unnamed protein product [Closterium sp. Naga37s-1]
MASSRISLHARRSCSLTRALISRHGLWAPHAPLALGTSALSTSVASTPSASSANGGSHSRSFSSAGDVADADVSPGELAGRKAAAQLQVLGVVGAGQMGSGIAQLGAMAGMRVVVADTSLAALDHCMAGIRHSLGRLVSKGRLDEVIGMHFMNPPVIMSLVEVVPGLATSDHTLHLTKGLAHRFGKAVCEARDYPGFIVNRLLMPMINEAFYALLEGVGTAQDIDRGMKLGTNQPMGPLHLADLIGLDTCVAIMRVLHAGLGDAKYRPCPLLVQYVDAGWLGRKSGRGVYEYPRQEEVGGEGEGEGGEKVVRGRQLPGRRAGH